MQHITKIVVTTVVQHSNLCHTKVREEWRSQGKKGSAEELDRESGEEKTTVGRTRRKDDG